MDSDNSDKQRWERAANPPPWAIELQAILVDRIASCESTLQYLVDRIHLQMVDHSTSSDESKFDENEYPRRSESNDSIASSELSLSDVESGDWLSIMLGADFCDDSKLSDLTLWIRKNVLAGNVQAVSLVGHLLVFRCANSDRKPSQLKEIGEAYYRCFRKSRDLVDPFEVALAHWSSHQCNAAGLPNSIELVHPGERFDATRHSPVERGGVEISEVLGWVVLRDGGRVYAKASVQTR